MQSLNPPKSLFLVRPDHFGFNSETAASNSFQQELEIKQEEIRKQVLEEFNALLNQLTKHEIDFHVFDSPENEITPDAVFPNNWISLHRDGTLILYPMLAENRRKERNRTIVDFICNKYDITRTIDITHYEDLGEILEGTGSLVFDHDAQIVYAAISPRTNEKLVNKIAKHLLYTPFCFEAIGPKSEEIYHTNVVMNIGSDYAIVCTDAIEDLLQRQMLIKKLEQSNKLVIPISYAQMLSFAGNMIEVQGQSGQSFLFLSQTAFNSLNDQQLILLKSRLELVPVDISTIEKIGGGSVRCMICGIHADKK